MTDRTLELAQTLAQLAAELREMVLVPVETLTVGCERWPLGLHSHDPLLDPSDPMMEGLSTDAAKVMEDLELPHGHLALVQSSPQRVVCLCRGDQSTDDERGRHRERGDPCDECGALQDLDLPGSMLPPVSAIRGLVLEGSLELSTEGFRPRGHPPMIREGRWADGPQ
jgi:hypothetical protein